eukprot:1243433-Rhodomonas_salina.2
MELLRQQREKSERHGPGSKLAKSRSMSPAALHGPSTSISAHNSGNNSDLSLRQDAYESERPLRPEDLRIVDSVDNLRTAVDSLKRGLGVNEGASFKPALSASDLSKLASHSAQTVHQQPGSGTEKTPESVASWTRKQPFGWAVPNCPTEKEICDISNKSAATAAKIKHLVHATFPIRGEHIHSFPSQSAPLDRGVSTIKMELAVRFPSSLSEMTLLREQILEDVRHATAAKPGQV